MSHLGFLHMARDDPSKILMQGSKTWNAWRKRNPGAGLSFSAPQWYHGPRGRRGAIMKGRNQLDFSRMNLSHAGIRYARAEGLNLQNAVLHTDKSAHSVPNLRTRSGHSPLN
jgi:hypothetical protein